MNQLRQALFIRTALESSNIQILCKNIDSSQIQKLRENLEFQKVALEIGNYSEIYNYFDQFHLLLCDFNSMPRIWEIVRTEKISLDRLHALAKTHMPRLGILYEQHIQIVEALNQRDVELCIWVCGGYTSDHTIDMQFCIPCINWANQPDNARLR